MCSKNEQAIKFPTESYLLVPISNWVVNSPREGSQAALVAEETQTDVILQQRRPKTV